MSNIKHPKEIDKLYYNEEISISEALRLWNIWENSTEEEKKENAVYIKILEKKAKKEAKTNNKTSGWITYLGWVVLIGITFYIMMALSSFA
tara:strand:- start:2162 stop:2434 length:273 start_codon:yes stop_codon:yes gene_type:complete